MVALSVVYWAVLRVEKMVASMVVQMAAMLASMTVEQTAAWRVVLKVDSLVAATVE